MLLSVLSARPLLRFLKTPPEIMEEAYSYIIIIFRGLPAVLVFNLCSNIMRAVGDSLTPLIFLSAACVINIILDYVFILVFHTGVEGAAYATVIAQLVSGLFCIPVIMAKLPILRIRREDWKIPRRELWEHLRVGLPMGFQMSVIAIGAVAVTYALNRLGALAVAAFTTSQKIDMLATMPLQSFGAAMTTYTAQNYGARKIDRIRAGIIRCLFMSASFAVLIGIVFFFFGGRLSSLFLGREGEAAALSHTYLRINGSFYILLSILFIFRQSLQGLGQSMVTTLAGMMELFMRAFAAIILSRYFGFTGISFSSPLAWAGALIPLSAAAVLTFRKLGRKILTEKKIRQT
jgi:putative MATE family efflux protein